MTMREYNVVDAEEEGAWTFSSNLASPHFKQPVNLYRHGFEQFVHNNPTLPKGKIKKQTKRQTRKNWAKAKKGGAGLSQKAVEQEMEKWEEKMKLLTSGRE